MNWTSLRTEDLEAALNKPQLETLKSARFKSEDRNIAEETISNVTAEIRATIAASEINFLDANHSAIPPELRECALRLCVERLMLRLPGTEPSRLQSRHADIARETLMRVSRGELPVTRPEDSVSTGSPRRGASVLSRRRKTASGESLGGL